MDTMTDFSTKGMAYMSWAKRWGNATPRQRQCAADILNAHLLMVEIMMSNVSDLYIHRVISLLKERGMMRQNLRRQARILEGISADLQKRCSLHDRMQVETFCRHIFPSLVPAYMECGGTLSLQLQILFHKTYGDNLELLYVATKKAVDRAGIPQSDLFSNVEMVAMIAQTGIDFYETILQKIKNLMDGIGKFSCVKSRHNEAMLCAAKEMLRSLGGKDVKLPEKESEDVRTLAARFQKELVDESLLKMIESAIVSLQTSFIEFVIATLRVEMESGHLPVSDIRTLTARIGTVENVRKLLDEIRRIPLPETEDFDIMDFAQSLPDSRTDSPLATFRRLCIEDHILTPPEEDENTVLKRSLRQEARKNDGILSLDTLRTLYARVKSKKAVIEYLAESGEELAPSIKMIKKMKAEELKQETI